MKILYKNASLDTHREARLVMKATKLSTMSLYSKARKNCVYFNVIDLQFNTLYFCNYKIVCICMYTDMYFTTLDLEN